MIYLCLGIILIIIVLIVLHENTNEAKYLKGEIAKAVSLKETLYWKDILSAYRLSILPGVTPQRVHTIRRVLMYGKHYKENVEKDCLVRLMLPSVIGICLCAVCMAGGSYAWFTASHSLPTQTIVSANYTVEILVNGKGVSLTDNAYNTNLEAGDYNITIIGAGSATTGYCAVTLGETTYRTLQIEKGKQITLEVKIYESTKLSIEPKWGELNTTETRLENNAKLTFGTPEDTGNLSEAVKEQTQPSVIADEINTQTIETSAVSSTESELKSEEINDEDSQEKIASSVSSSNETP